MFICSNDNKSNTVSQEENSKRKEEEKVIKEIQKAAIELNSNKKKNHNNSSQNHSDTKNKKKSISNKRKSNINTTLVLGVKKGSSQQFKKQLMIKTSDEYMQYSAIPPISSSSYKHKTKSLSTLCHNFDDKKNGKTPRIEIPKRKSVKLNTFGNHKNS